MTVNEIREKHNLDPLDGMDIILILLQVKLQ
jgi:hypothetical protein